MSVVTTYPWRIQWAEQPYPEAVRRRYFDFIVVSVGLPLGVRALEAMAAEALPVGPVMSCGVHSRVHVPTLMRDLPLLRDTGAVLQPHDLGCPDDGRSGLGRCPARFWMTLGTTGGLTDCTAFVEALRRTRRAYAEAGRTLDSWPPPT